MYAQTYAYQGTTPEDQRQYLQTTTMQHNPGQSTPALVDKRALTHTGTIPEDQRQCL